MNLSQAKKGGKQLAVACFFFGGLFGKMLPAAAQDYPYIQSKGRFDFAQTYLGLDFLKPSLLETNYLTETGEEKTAHLQMPWIPRLTIGGLHFWGYADFYVTFPLAPKVAKGDLQLKYSPGVETGFRLYPLRLEPNRVTPFLGVAWNVRRYQQKVGNKQGPNVSHSLMSQNLGLAWATKFGIFEAGYQFYSTAGSTFRYPISRTNKAKTQAPTSSYWVGYKWVIDTTASAKSSVSEKLSTSKNAFTLGIGPSSAFTLGDSSYFEKERPFLNPHPIAPIFLDYSIGYYFGKADFALNLSYRSIPMKQSVYGVDYSAKRDVVSLEAMKFLLDYEGFDPFLGVSWNQEKLSVHEKDAGQTTLNASKVVSVPGMIFGWDIRPTANPFVILRTNLRYVPSLHLEVASGKNISFEQLEFNFIQAVFHFR